MTRRLRAGWPIAILLLIYGSVEGGTQPAPAPGEPHIYEYRTVGDDSLKAYVFSPTPRANEAANAVLLFHGGGWASGAPEWVFATAERFASYGLVAIAIEYRLADSSTTPIDALDDVCHALEWTHGHAAELGITDKIAGYGVSAGGQLIAAAATVGCSGSDPKLDALLLWSPAIDVVNDGYFAKLLQGRGKAIDYSPADHVSATTPPTCIVQGAKDTLTPLAGAQKFHDRMVKAGAVCELNVYPDVGHLLTRKLDNQETDFDPDPAKRADGIEKFRLFLIRTGFIPNG